MIYLKTKDTDTGRIFESLLFCWGDVHRLTFSPDVERVALVEFKTHGKTYEERRESVRKTCKVLFDNLGGSSDLSMMDLAKMRQWIDKNARRLGLVEELREAGFDM